MKGCDDNWFEVVGWVRNGCNVLSSIAPPIEHLEQYERKGFLIRAETLGGGISWFLSNAGMYEYKRIGISSSGWIGCLLMGEQLHPDGSDCDYCTYDKLCITITNTLPRSVKNLVPNHQTRSNMPETDIATVDSQQAVIDLILDERNSQDAKWGDQSGHSDFVWLGILMEEVGEAAKCALHNLFGGKESGRLTTELVQVAAVSVAWIEAIYSRGQNRTNQQLTATDGIEQ